MVDNFERVLVLLVMAITIGYAANVYGQGNGPPDGVPPGHHQRGDYGVVLDADDAPASSAASVRGSSDGCDTSGASMQVKVLGIGIAGPSYPCEIVRTYDAVAATRRLDENGNVRGFWTGTLPRKFLWTRLITKGVFASIFGLVGLG